MLSKGKQIELKIASLAPGGEGVSKDFAVPVFINKAAPGDTLLTEIYDYRKSFAKGKLLKVVEPSKDRIEPECKLFKVCGGCQWMHLNYQAQLDYKRSLIEQSLHHIAGQELGAALSAVLLPTVPSEKQFAYRNKVQLPARNPKNSKRILAGYFETNSHDLVNIKHCPIQPSLLDKVLEQIKDLGEQFGISAYSEESGEGLLRHIHMRINQKEDSILITLVLNCRADQAPGYLKRFADQMMAQFPEIKGLCANFNNKEGNRILGDKTICVAGLGYIEESLATDKKDLPLLLQNGLRFQLSPDSFFQVNTKQAIKLLELIAKEVHDFITSKANSKKSPINLLDTYAGVGTIALWLAPLVSKVIAIESNAQAVKDGEVNQKLNNINNVQFHLSKVEDYLPTILESKTAVDILVLDPPRQGLHPQVIETIIKLKPQLILYVSCNPVTLARDLRLLLLPETINLASSKESSNNADISCLKSNSGYKVEKIIPVDLFPQTYHVESITVLKRQ